MFFVTVTCFVPSVRLIFLLLLRARKTLRFLCFIIAFLLLSFCEIVFTDILREGQGDSDS
ncbi:unnamed protein product [Brassica oleracea]